MHFTEVRHATERDFAAVCNLLALLGRPTVTPETQAACAAVFIEQITNATSDHLVAVNEDNQPIGFVSLHYRPRLNHPTPEAWIPDLIVDERYRRQGAARELLTKAKTLATAHNCHRLTLESGHQRQAAHQLYRASGLVDDGLFFTLELP